jgi:hypothetical protein
MRGIRLNKVGCDIYKTRLKRINEIRLALVIASLC